MADTLDSDIISEEIDTGSGTSTSVSSPSPTEEFSFGSIQVESPVDETPVSAKANTPYVAPKIEEAPGDIVSLDNLRAVSAQFSTGCQSFQDVVDGSGLSKDVVLACLKWLRENGIVSVSNSFYCTIDNVTSLQSQLKTCVGCSKK